LFSEADAMPRYHPFLSGRKMGKEKHAYTDCFNNVSEWNFEYALRLNGMVAGSQTK
jgi:hypothetical protein